MLFSALDTTKERVCEVEDGVEEITQTETQRKTEVQKQEQQQQNSCGIISSALTYKS